MAEAWQPLREPSKGHRSGSGRLLPLLAPAVRRAWAGSPPRRHYDSIEVAVRDAARPLLHPGAVVLDVGSGRRPVLVPAERARGTRYVGLDLSASELRSAPPGSYDAIVVADAARRQPELEGGFDLVLTWWLLEHVQALDPVLDNLHAYLRPGGRMVAYLAGRYALASIANRLLPHRLSVWLLRVVTARPVDSVFPARYDRCTHAGLSEALSDWSTARITPLYDGFQVVGFSRLTRTAYAAYEEWAYRREKRDLATHYLVVADA